MPQAEARVVHIDPRQGRRKARAEARAFTAPLSYGTVLTGARRLKGAVVAAADGIERLDFVNAAGAVLLGWADPEVEAAVARAYGDDRDLEGRAAEQLSAYIPCADAVAFRSTVSEALGDALLAAKAATGRDGAFFCDQDTVLAGDLLTLQATLGAHAGQVAAIVVQPMDAPCAFLTGLRRLADLHGAVLVFDEARTAFRVHAGGAQALAGVRPDLAVLGPSLANGRPLAAICGRVEVMRLLPAAGPKVSTAALAAASVTLRKIDSEDVAAHLRVRGAEISAEVEARLRETGADAWLGVHGDPTWSVVAAMPRPGFDSGALERTLNEMLFGEGILSFGAHTPSLATGEREIGALLAAYDAVLPKLVKRVRAGGFNLRRRGSADA